MAAGEAYERWRATAPPGEKFPAHMYPGLVLYIGPNRFLVRQVRVRQQSVCSSFEARDTSCEILGVVVCVHLSVCLGWCMRDCLPLEFRAHVYSPVVQVAAEVQARYKKKMHQPGMELIGQLSATDRDNVESCQV